MLLRRYHKEKNNEVKEAKTKKVKEIDYEKMDYNELRALAKEKGIVLRKSPKKDEILKALQEVGE